jgi:hypothetical protein
MSQASADISCYLAKDPPVTYDRSSKRYIGGEDFRPVLKAPDAARFLGELRLLEHGVLREQETTLGAAPPFSMAPVPERPVDAYVLRAVMHAIREARILNVRYQSLSRPQPVRRRIEPHALAYDGFRWHARAFDAETREFRDFVLGRMSKPILGTTAISRPSEDRDWQTTIDIVIAPHPGLTRAQTLAIKQDYGIKGESTRIPVRRALLYYALKRLGLDVPPSTRPPSEQHIVLMNRYEIKAGLARRRDKR